MFVYSVVGVISLTDGWKELYLILNKKNTKCLIALVYRICLVSYQYKESEKIYDKLTE